jgi:hypothetical protein
MISTYFDNVKKLQFFEKMFQSNQVLFTLLILYQGLFGALFMSPPEILSKQKDNKIFKIVQILTVAFAATRDVEVAVFSTILFLVFIHTLRKPHERKFPY